MGTLARLRMGGPPMGSLPQHLDGLWAACVLCAALTAYGLPPQGEGCVDGLWAASAGGVLEPLWARSYLPIDPT